MATRPNAPEPASPPPQAPPRTRLPGWARGGLGVIAALLLLLGIGWGWQRAELARIPDIGDPFDVAAVLRDFPDRLPPEQNAFTYYKLACEELPRGGFNTTRDVAVVEDWAFASDDWKERIAEARPALGRWREGTERDEAVYHRTDEMSIATLLTVTQHLRSTIMPLVLAEGSRLEADGEMAEAWGWYRALLRCSRHSGRNGFLIERLVGAVIFDKTAARIRRWAADDRVDARLLREALGETRAALALTADNVPIAQLEYMILRRAIDDPKLFGELLDMSRQRPNSPPPPTGPARYLAQLEISELLGRARLHSGYEAERCRRLLQLLWANRLPQLARPAEERAKLASENPVVFEDDPTAPASARMLPPGDLAARARKTPLGWEQKDAFGVWLARFDKERIERARLVVDLAGELYRREHGAAPASAEALVPDYLDRLPDGFRPRGDDDGEPETP